MLVVFLLLFYFIIEVTANTVNRIVFWMR